MKAAERFRSHHAARRLIAAFAAMVVLAFGAALLWKSQEAEANAQVDELVADARFNTEERAAIEALVRNYILEHPEILPEAIERLRLKESAEQLSEIGDGLRTPFPGAVLGNPDGERTLVSFTDYACGYCRASLKDVQALIAADDELRVVIREYPILSQDSVDAAHMALAAAKQGKYAAFHDAMYALGRPTPANIASAARTAGLDMERARADAQDPALGAEIEANRRFAAQLQVNGTPAWVAGDQILQGAVGQATLSEALYGKGG